MGVLGVVVAAVLGGCQDESAEVGNAPESPVIDETVGTYREVGLGSSLSAVQGRLGPSPHPEKRYAGKPFRAEKIHPSAAPLVCARGRRLRTLTYDFVSFTAQQDRVCDVVIAEDGAATRRGIAIGDSLDEAREVYPEVHCGREEISTETPPVDFPFCTYFARGVNVWFGGDPIDTIELNRRRFRTSAELASP